MASIPCPSPESKRSGNSEAGCVASVETEGVKPRRPNVELPPHPVCARSRRQNPRLSCEPPECEALAPKNPDRRRQRDVRAVGQAAGPLALPQRNERDPHRGTNPCP